MADLDGLDFSKAVVDRTVLEASTPARFLSPAMVPSWDLDLDSDQLPGLMSTTSEPPAPRPSRRVILRMPAVHQDLIPAAPPAVYDSDGASATDDETCDNKSDDERPRLTTKIKKIRLIVRDQISAATKTFHLFRKYLHRPSYDPDHEVPAEMLSNIAQPLVNAGSLPTLTPVPEGDFSVPGVMGWMNNGNDKKSNAEMDKLVHEVLLHPRFDASELSGFSAQRENKRIDEAENDLHATPFSDGFQETSLKIEVSNGDIITPKTSCFTVPGLHYRKLCSVIKAAFSEPLAKSFHTSPFKLFQNTPGGDGAQRVFSEVYNTDTFINEHDQVQRAPTDDVNCTLEKTVAALMFWSDSTHLANFGTASMWPVYLFFGNLSQYIRSCPTSGACHHIAYIPSLPDSFQDAVSNFNVKWSTQHKEILTHCKRELMHEVWKELLDDELLHAYKYGMVVMCADGVRRRLYPRIFTYSADYPEK